MKQVWLLGDSIRVNYQHVVSRELEGIASVSAPSENGRFARYTYCMFHRWTDAFPRPDVIHWNCGIWDSGHFSPNGPCLTSDNDYRADLIRLSDELAATGARLIFATSTPVLPLDDSNPDRELFNRDIERLNRIAVNVLSCRGIRINDLHRAVSEDAARFIGSDGIHLTAAGMERCGRQTAASIRSAL